MVERDEILRLAKLSKLSLTSAEISDFTADMNDIVSFAHEVSRAESEDNNVFCKDYISLREDIIKPSYSAQDILKNAPSAEDGYFKLQKRSDNN